MRLKKSHLLFLIPLLLLTQAYSCSKYHTAVVVEHDFVTAVAAFQQGELALYQAGEITPAEHQNIEGLLVKIATAGQALNAVITANGSQQSVNSEAQILISAISDLNTNGVLGIKNVQAQQTLSVALKAISDIMQNLATALGATP